jgi:hypothetical protein
MGKITNVYKLCSENLNDNNKWILKIGHEGMIMIDLTQNRIQRTGFCGHGDKLADFI